MPAAPDRPFASVILPIWRDAALLQQALGALPPRRDVELIAAVVLGEEEEFAAIGAARPDVRWVSAPRGRAAQMNAGAEAASGRWLLFLHADSRLPADWLDVVARADAERGVVGGSFRLALDSADWRARVLEWGVRLRVTVAGLPYGDQSIFVRREVFTAVGGYQDWPLMEDVDLVRRLAAAGRLHHSSSAVVTSARRWEQDGWLRRSGVNLTLSARFFLGAPPARLAQCYLNRSPRAVVMMARAPWTGGKTRLAGVADGRALAELREALFADTLEVMRSVPDTQRLVACEPASEVRRCREAAGAAVEVIAQRGGDLGDRLTHVFADAFRLGAESVVVIGSDLPDLPARLITAAFAALAAQPDGVVLGPAEDGGYYLIGLCRAHPSLFAGIAWSSPDVLEATVKIAERQRLPVTLLQRWRDVDEPGDIAGFLDRPSGGPARRTRAWIHGHPEAASPPDAPGNRPGIP